METVLILLLLLFLYLVINNYRKCEGFSGDCSSKSLVTFYKNTNKIDDLTPKEKEDILLKKLEACRYEDDIDAFKAWAESGIGRSDISDYHDLKPNNQKCVYEVGFHGGEYEEIISEDLDNYYEAPIQNNYDASERQTPEKLKKMLDDYRKTLKGDATGSYKQSIDDFFKKSDTSGKLTAQQYGSIREWLEFQRTDEQTKQFKQLGKIDKAYHRCDTPYARNKDNLRVNRPDIRLDGKVKSQNSTIPIPCSKPLLPWLEDPGDEDEYNRKYCKPQTTPCENCGKFSDTPIYGYRYDKPIDGELFHGPIDGPNRRPQAENTDFLREDEYYGDDGFVKDLRLFGAKP